MRFEEQEVDDAEIRDVLVLFEILPLFRANHGR
jgi:hypothetical protein